MENSSNKDLSSVDEADDQKPWLTFLIDNETYAIEALDTQEVLQQTIVTPVPGAPSDILGVINVRGTIVTVLDARTMLGLPRKEVTSQTRIILIEANNDRQGLLVDGVAEIVSIKASEIDSTPSTAEGRDYVTGTCHQNKKLYILLSVSKLMSREDVC